MIRQQSFRIRRTTVWLGVVATFALAARGAEIGEPQRREFAEIHMAMRFTIVFYAADSDAANRAARAAYDRIRDINRVASDYDPNSELSRLSATAGSGKCVPLSDDLWRLLSAAQELSARTDGAFDVTVGPYTRLWRQARKKKTLPDEETLAAARRAVGYKHLTLDPANRTARLTQPGMALDLGGIAAGYAADEALAVLKRRGFAQAMVDSSGDVVCGDPPPGKPGWKILVAPPPGEKPTTVSYLILSNAAVTTSGDAVQFVEIGGQRYSHIVDPRTGLGMTDHCQATVVAPRCIDADSLATAVVVLGHQAGLALIDKTPDAAAQVSHRVEDRPERRASTRWKQLRIETQPAK